MFLLIFFLISEHNVHFVGDFKYSLILIKLFENYSYGWGRIILTRTIKTLAFFPSAFELDHHNLKSLSLTDYISNFESSAAFKSHLRYRLTN